VTLSRGARNGTDWGWVEGTDTGATVTDVGTDTCDDDGSTTRVGLPGTPLFGDGVETGEEVEVSAFVVECEVGRGNGDSGGCFMELTVRKRV
jgi:hypothetical protein